MDILYVRSRLPPKNCDSSIKSPLAFDCTKLSFGITDCLAECHEQYGQDNGYIMFALTMNDGAALAIQNVVCAELRHTSALHGVYYVDTSEIIRLYMPHAKLEISDYENYVRVAWMLWSRIVNIIAAVWPGKYSNYGRLYTPKERIISEAQPSMSDDGSIIQGRPPVVEIDFLWSYISQNDPRISTVIQ